MSSIISIKMRCFCWSRFILVNWTAWKQLGLCCWQFDVCGRVWCCISIYFIAYVITHQLKGYSCLSERMGQRANALLSGNVISWRQRSCPKCFTARREREHSRRLLTDLSISNVNTNISRIKIFLNFLVLKWSHTCICRPYAWMDFFSFVTN